MYNPYISVIVPVYNTGLILCQTIDSILNQSFKNFELLLINDGSSDSSGLVCDKYALKDSRISVIHKKNGGICDARNVGLELAKGEYVAFCDHDDIFELDLLEKTINAAQQNNADIIKFGIKCETQNSKKKKHKIKSYKKMILTREDIKIKLFHYINQGLFFNIWDCIFKRDFLLKNNLKFNTKYQKGHEDINFNNLLLPCINSMVVLENILYTHCIRKSLSTSAGLHEEIISRFLEYPTDIKLTSSAMGIDLKLQQIDYYYFFIYNSFIPVLSYMSKMGKNKDMFISKLDILYRNNSELTSLKINIFQFFILYKGFNDIIAYLLVKGFFRKRFTLLFYIYKFKVRFLISNKT